MQRGSRLQAVFFSGHDKKIYIRLLHKSAVRFGVEFCAYCLMDNHVHLIAVPKQTNSLERCFGEAHREYSRMITLREGWRGHLWQERFFSCPMDRPYLFNAVHYIELNPVRAGLVQNADEYPWSSAHSHMHNLPDMLLSDHALIEETAGRESYLSICDDENLLFTMRKYSSTGRPLGNDRFIYELEKLTGWTLKKKEPRPKKRTRKQIGILSPQLRPGRIMLTTNSPSAYTASIEPPLFSTILFVIASPRPVPGTVSPLPL